MSEQQRDRGAVKNDMVNIQKQRDACCGTDDGRAEKQILLQIKGSDKGSNVKIVRTNDGDLCLAVAQKLVRLAVLIQRKACFQIRMCIHRRTDGAAEPFDVHLGAECDFERDIIRGIDSGELLCEDAILSLG